MYAWAEVKLRQWRGGASPQERKISLPVTQLAGQGDTIAFHCVFWNLNLRAELYVVFLNASLVQVTGNGISGSLYGQCGFYPRETNLKLFFSGSSTFFVRFPTFFSILFSIVLIFYMNSSSLLWKQTVARKSWGWYLSFY
jgi:hypothetical protein